VTAKRKSAVLGLVLALIAGASAAHGAGSVRLEDFTWTELKAAIDSGTTTIIVPIGGTEQSGPAMALGKHNGRVEIMAAKIAVALEHTLVAPVVAYVPDAGILVVQYVDGRTFTDEDLRDARQLRIGFGESLRRGETRVRGVDVARRHWRIDHHRRAHAVLVERYAADDLLLRELGVLAARDVELEDARVDTIARREVE